uniref:Uncharacterized protein n=1 Tax=Salix viminalis TaxID=40686 RepID=A0A6N2MAU5_SALVM
MEEIKHSLVEVNGLKLHVAEIGTDSWANSSLGRYLPPWFSEEDLAVYASSYLKSGFRYPLQVPYRTLGIDCGITNPKVEAPTLLIMGEKDYALSFPGNADYIKSDKLKHIVPDLETVFVEEGNHFGFYIMVPKLKATFFVPDLDMVFLEEANHFVREKHPKQAIKMIHQIHFNNYQKGFFTLTSDRKNLYILYSGTEPTAAEEDQEIMELIDLYISSPPSEEDLAVYVV